MKSVLLLAGAGVALLSLAGCGRTGLPSAHCLLVTTPSSLDLGEVAPGATHTGFVSLENQGGEECLISGIMLAPNSGGGFSLPVAPSAIALWPRQSAVIAVAFSPSAVALPLTRSGTLLFQSNDAKVEVPLTARIHSDCRIAIDPATLDFGHVALGASASRAATVTDVGTGPCILGGVAIGSASDPEFALAAGQPTLLTLAPGGSATLGVTFTATDVAPPHHRTGTLIFQSTDPNQADAAVPLQADIDIGCDLTWSPPSLDFGNVILNTSATAAVTLGNDGSAACQVSAIALGAGTDPGFTLAPGQASAFTVAPGATQTIPITFTASDSAPPHLKTGTLLFLTGNTRAPNATVPLSAFVNTVCVEASQWIYTVDQSNTFSRFDPATLTFNDIGGLGCNDDSGPQSMAVDQNAVAWVEYSDGRLFQVDTGTAACAATTFVPNQQGLATFGMGFVFDPTTGMDTLFIAGGSGANQTQSTLATVSFPGLAVTTIGATEGVPELSGTGDGTLWGFFPASASSSGVAQLTRIDPTSGATLESHEYPSLMGGGAWAMKFWGGSFWIFLDQSVYKVDRAAPKTVTRVIADTGRTVVGAGVSTCAPLH